MKKIKFTHMLSWLAIVLALSGTVGCETVCYRSEFYYRFESMMVDGQPVADVGWEQDELIRWGAEYGQTSPDSSGVVLYLGLFTMAGNKTRDREWDQFLEETAP